MEKTKILFVMETLGRGGAQRVVSHILRNIEKTEFEVYLSVINAQGDYMDMVPGDVNMINLNKKKVWSSFFSLVRLIKNIRPHIIFTTGLNYYVMLCWALKLFRKKPKLVLRVSNFLSRKTEGKPYHVRLLLKPSLKKADAVISLAEEMGKDLIDNYRVDPGKITLINNPADVDFISSHAKETVDHPWLQKERKDPVITAVGRLAPQKDYPTLLNSLKEILKKHGAKLLILGRGDLLDELKELQKKLGLQDNVDFLGFQDNPYKYIAASDVFVLSSLWEGFPNVLVEAMACGVPVVAADCPSGPKEIITNGEDGLLVPMTDPVSMADAVARVLEDQTFAKTLTDNAFESLKRYDISNIVKQYEEVFRRVIKE